jgi:molecular chaperone GrpE
VSGKGNGGDAVAVPAPAAAEPAREDAAAPDLALEPAEGRPEEPSTGAEDEVAALRRERDELKETLLRRRADFENFRRRAERERAAAAVEAETAVLRRLLDTVDNLERALAAGGADSGLREGVELTHRELVALLDSLGVVAIAPLGERFDPALHQAILHEPAAGFEEGTVAEVFRKGYTYKDRLLRPALVKVASAGGGPAGGADAGQGRAE